MLMTKHSLQVTGKRRITETTLCDKLSKEDGSHFDRKKYRHNIDLARNPDFFKNKVTQRNDFKEQMETILENLEHLKLSHKK